MSPLLSLLLNASDIKKAKEDTPLAFLIEKIDCYAV